MKKALITGTIALASALLLAGCANTSAAGDARLKADNSSLKQEVKSLKGQVQLLAAASDLDDQDTDSDNDQTQTTQATAVMGKEYVIKDQDGKKLVGLTLTQADNKFSGFALQDDMLDDSDFNQGKKANLVQVALKFTNYGLDDDWEPSTGLAVYDSTGTQAKVSDYEDGGDEVSVGHSGTLTMWFILSQPYAANKKLEIEYSDYLTPAGGSIDDDEEASAKWVVE